MLRRDAVNKSVSGAAVDPSTNDFLKMSGVRSDLDYFEDSLTRQEFAEECDINTIMAKYEAGGAVSHVNRHTPVYLDCTTFGDLRENLDAFREAQLAFAALPAIVRKEFDNDPVKFVEFCDSEGSLDRMREWGLAPPAPVPTAPIKVEVVTPPGASSSEPGKPA